MKDGFRVIYRDELPRYEGSMPGVTEFDPKFIPWQFQAMKLIRGGEYDYSQGVLELLLSGALGSAKSIWLAHVVVTHCLMYPKARAGIGRRAMPDLKATIFQAICEHLRNDEKLVEGVDYRIGSSPVQIKFRNGSEIIARSWADRKEKKGRSIALSLLAVEELTENEAEDKASILELRQRVGRLPHVPEQLFIAATNPDEPDHWAHDYFIANPTINRRVIYSVTTDNPFLPPFYREQLLRDLDPKMAQRMIHGRWLSIAREGIYHQYEPQLHQPENDYVASEQYPIVVAFDFNIGVGKPLSCCFSQMRDGLKHFYEEVVIEGARTQNALEDAWNRGLFEPNTIYYIRGDATGMARDTRNNINDYEVIREWMNRQVRKDGSRIMFTMQVPSINPPVRTRHNVVNAWLRNDLGQVRVKVYPKAKVLREGFKQVKLKPGAQYMEDDSKYFQHVTTAAGYDIVYENNLQRRGKTGVHQL